MLPQIKQSSHRSANGDCPVLQKERRFLLVH
nr:MAG TPA: hypothetical protein [Caudoviricetes sp.]